MTNTKNPNAKETAVLVAAQALVAALRATNKNIDGIELNVRTDGRTTIRTVEMRNCREVTLSTDRFYRDGDSDRDDGEWIRDLPAYLQSAE